MGREVECECILDSARFKVKAFLEPPELILRGGVSRRIPLAQISSTAIVGEALEIAAGEERIALILGATAAAKWKLALSTPPPTLAKKLGISDLTTVLVIGECDDEDLRAAIAIGEQTCHESPDIVIARVANTVEIVAAIAVYGSLGKDVKRAMWVVYPKGKNDHISEAIVRETMLEAGFVDTKVASVSSKLTALKFTPRREVGVGCK